MTSEKGSGSDYVYERRESFPETPIQGGSRASTGSFSLGGSPVFVDTSDFSSLAAKLDWATEMASQSPTQRYVALSSSDTDSNPDFPTLGIRTQTRARAARRNPSHRPTSRHSRQSRPRFVLLLVRAIRISTTVILKSSPRRLQLERSALPCRPRCSSTSRSLSTGLSSDLTT